MAYFSKNKYCFWELVLTNPVYNAILDCQLGEFCSVKNSGEISKLTSVLSQIRHDTLCLVSDSFQSIHLIGASRLSAE